ncbi:MAG: hypothetical protein AABY68_08395 [Pseudomonadota bacterium]
MPKIKKLHILSLLGAVFLVSANTNAASDDWSSRWRPNESRVNSNLTQANLIKLAESDYYDNVGKSTTNNTTNIGEVNNISNIGQNTNAIGSVNNSTNNIKIDGSDNNLNLANTATNNNSALDAGITTSTQNGSINGCINLSVQNAGPGTC